MIGASLQTTLFVLWGVATAAFITVMVMKSLAGLREEDAVVPSAETNG